MTDFAMPQALELEAVRRQGIPAVRREVVHNTTTQNEYRPSELCYIPVDTGAAGAFMDTTCTRLEMTVVVRNKNYFVDFINLPRCGWNAIIQEFGIEINNGLHELNRHYAECIELDMIKRGENRTPFEICRQNPYKVGEGIVGLKHINFVKPSMVTSNGMPHNVKLPALPTSTANTTCNTLQTALTYANLFTHESFGRSLGSEIPVSAFSTPIDYETELGGVQTTSFVIGASHWDDRVQRPRNEQRKLAYNSTYTSTGAELAPTVIGDFMNINSNYRVVGTPNAGTLGFSNALQSHDPSSTATQYGANVYLANYGQSFTNISPAQWPAYQPTDWTALQKDIKESLRYVNSDNIINYYANCKNIPVGIPLDLSGDPSGEAAIWGDSLHVKPTVDVNGAETEFNISLKVYSSLIGELTKKWFPELVVPQGRMRIRLRFQEPQILFQTLMDPCRRVPGTSRDWFPYLGCVRSEELVTVNRPASGSPDTNPVAGTLIATHPIGDLKKASVECVASGIHPAMVMGYYPGFVFNPSIAAGTFAIPTLRLKSMNECVGQGFYMADYARQTAGTATSLNTYFPTSTQTRAIRSSTLENQVTTDDPSDFIINSPTTVAELNQKLNSVFKLVIQMGWEQYMNGEYGCPWLYRPNHNSSAQPYTAKATTDVSIRISDTHEMHFPTGYRNLMPGQANYAEEKNDIITTEHDVAGEQYWNNNWNWDQKWKGVNYHPYCIPTPQYVPIYNPSDKRSSRVLNDENLFLQEEECCFGTHLQHAVAQVRRTHSTLYPLYIPDSITSRIDERLTYIVKNVQLVTQQIILPRTAAISIVENALNGGITMETVAWKEMESILPKAESQKHLINMAAAFCNSLSFVFRPTDIYQGDRAYGYNSFSFYNPFTVFRFDFDASITPQSSTSAGYNDLGGKPIYYNECVIATRVPFDIQLQLSGELYPRTPIDTINRLLMHTRWGDQVFSSADYMELAPALQPSYLTSKGMAINTLQDGFWAAFCPISALDDQTLTDNPFFNPLEISLRKRLRGMRAPVGPLPIYKPYDGTFHLSFNLEAFMGQSGRMRTGVPIVNNNMFLRMEKCHLIREYDTQLLTICECDAKVVFERGGTMQFFT
jgi:hypothetical protein